MFLVLFPLIGTLKIHATWQWCWKVSVIFRFLPPQTLDSLDSFELFCMLGRVGSGCSVQVVQVRPGFERFYSLFESLCGGVALEVEDLYCCVGVRENKRKRKSGQVGAVTMVPDTYFTLWHCVLMYIGTILSGCFQIRMTLNVFLFTCFSCTFTQYQCSSTNDLFGHFPLVHFNLVVDSTKLGLIKLCFTSNNVKDGWHLVFRNKL